MIDFGSKFSQGLTYDDFLAAHGGEIDRAKWKNVFDKVQLADEQQSVLASFKRQIKVLCLAGAWCGDCVRQCPILQVFAETQPLIQLRFIDRDADTELQSEMKICGATRVPQFVFLSEDDQPVGRYGDRTITYYRDMAAKIDGAACSTGIVADHDPVFVGVINDWLTELERCHLILRTSPRLREKHGD